MKRTVVLIKKDQTVTILEDVNAKEYKQLTSETNDLKKKSTANNDSHIIWCNQMIDLEYGY